VLIAAIDEKEYLRLGMLLQQTFAGSDVQMVTVITNRAGSPRAGRFARVEEYLFVVFVGSASVNQWTSTMLSDELKATAMPNVWFSAIRVGTGSALREARPALFYPVLLAADTGTFQSVGEPIPLGSSRADYVAPPGTIAMWPLSTEGREQTWRFSNTRMREYFDAGTARLGRPDSDTGIRPVTYLRPGTLENIANGVFEVTGRTDEGALVLGLTAGAAKPVAPATVWNVTSHYARDHGSKLNEKLIPGRSFPYPKSLYAVEDTLRFTMASKPDGIVLDFFAGSGTTTHAVARLNRQDGGSRQSIVVTNNEVSTSEADALGKRGLRQGDPEWEALGIFQHITRPRITAAVMGLTPDGDPVKGDYKFTDEFPMADGFEENVEFVELTYQDPDDIELDLAFEAIAPLLWMRAGGQGPVIDNFLDAAERRKPYAWTEQYGVLFNTDRWRSFVEKLPASATTAFVVTDSPATFAGIAAELPDHLDVVRLYENYLTTFRINEGLV
jgi:adenine-specific DNA-methyltransferase